MGHKKPSEKGGEYERHLCKELSLWWTDGANDDVFWRAHGSGGRAKRRGNKGQETYGAHGDAIVTNPIGQPFIDLITLEIKRGYSAHTIQDLMDRMPAGQVGVAMQQEMEKWIDQVMTSWEQSGSYSWMLVHKRDKREALCYIPDTLMAEFQVHGAFGESPPDMFCQCKLDVVRKKEDEYASWPLVLYVVKLSDFLREVTPFIVQSITPGV